MHWMCAVAKAFAGAIAVDWNIFHLSQRLNRVTNDTAKAAIWAREWIPNTPGKNSLARLSICGNLLVTTRRKIGSRAPREHFLTMGFWEAACRASDDMTINSMHQCLSDVRTGDHASAPKPMHEQINATLCKQNSM